MMLKSALLTSTTTLARAEPDDANAASQTVPNSGIIRCRTLRQPPHAIHWRTIVVPLLGRCLWYLRGDVGISGRRVFRVKAARLQSKSVRPAIPWLARPHI